MQCRNPHSSMEKLLYRDIHPSHITLHNLYAYLIAMCLDNTTRHSNGIVSCVTYEEFAESAHFLTSYMSHC